MLYALLLSKSSGKYLHHPLATKHTHSQDKHHICAVGKSVTCTDSGIYPTYLHNGRNDQKQIIHTCKTYNLVGGRISPFENPYVQGSNLII